MKVSRRAVVEQLFVDAMTKREWTLLNIGRQKMFVRQSRVSPCLFARGDWRQGEVFIIDGAIGIHYQEFEEWWRSANGVGKAMVNDRDMPALLLHLGNFPRLNRYVRYSRVASDVEAACQQLCALLAEMPDDEDSLRKAFADRSLLGKPIGVFGSACPEKLEEFEGFLVGRNA